MTAGPPWIREVLLQPWDPISPTWNAALRRHADATGENPSEVARAYDLPPEAVREALDYYHEHKAVIDARVLLNIA